MTRSEREWERAYDEAVQWRDWMTCDQLLAERYGTIAQPTPKRSPRFRRYGARLITIPTSRYPSRGQSHSSYWLSTRANFLST